LPSSSIARSSTHEHLLRFEIETDVAEGGFLAPLAGASLGGGCFLGLKPQAEFWSPVGARHQMSKLPAEGLSWSGQPLREQNTPVRRPLVHCFRAILLLVVILTARSAFAQDAASVQGDLGRRLPQLSEGAEVSLITYSPGEELYQSFGHSAIRVRDELLGLDRLYNFGVFDFETPNFYVRFAHGDLLYQLAVSQADEEIRMVGAYGQGVSELPLNFTLAQKQSLFEALEINLLPENRFYRYDFILDNCSTRPRDVIERITGSPVVLRSAEQQTFRDMLTPYFTRMPWVGFGVSLLMGANVDRLASPREACFLPADLERAVQTSKNGEQNLAIKRKEIFAPEILPASSPLLSPICIFYGAGIFWILFWLLRRKGHARWPTAIALMILGALGSFVLGLSFWTRLLVLHSNYNLLWLIPLHFPAGLWLLLAKGRPALLQWYLWFAFLAAVFFVCFSFLLPQRFSPAVIPLLIIVAWRCGLEVFGDRIQNSRFRIRGRGTTKVWTTDL
jgi:Domain of unknown function (DUF4105)